MHSHLLRLLGLAHDPVCAAYKRLPPVDLLCGSIFIEGWCLPLCWSISIEGWRAGVSLLFALVQEYLESEAGFAEVVASVKSWKEGGVHSIPVALIRQVGG